MGGNILGFPIKQVALAGAAVIGAPYIEAQIMKVLPVSFAGTTAGRWTGKIGAAVATGYIAQLAMGNEAARLAYIVLGANLMADAVAEFQSHQAAGVGYHQGLGMFSANGLVTSGARTSALNTYQGVNPLMVVPSSFANDPYKSVF